MFSQVVAIYDLLTVLVAPVAVIYLSFLALNWLVCQILYVSFKQDPPNGKAVVVTGAASGIGKALAEGLVKEGYFVYAVDVNKDALQHAFSKNHKVEVCHIDVSCEDDINKLGQQIEHSGKILFALINMAALCGPGAILEEKREARHKLFEVNIIGMIDLTQCLYKLIVASKGFIINCSSGAGMLALPFVNSYSTTKFAVCGFSQTLRNELAATGVKVMVVYPGLISTPMISNLKKKLSESQEKSSNSIFSHLAKGCDVLYNKNFSFLEIPPERVAKEIIKVMRSKYPPESIMVPYWLTFPLTIMVHALPERVSEWILRVIYSQNK